MVSISASAIAAIAYLILVVGSLAIFSTIYRRRRALQSSNLEPWFPEHKERDIYLTLLHFDTPVSPKLLKAALFERAREDISRIYKLRESKTAATLLLQKGSISESTFQQIIAAEADLNAEIADVMAEAKALGGEEWGQNILPQANEYHQKSTILKTIERAKKMAETNKKEWVEEQELRKEYADQQREAALKELAGVENVNSNGVANGNGGLEGEIPEGDGVRSEGSAERKKKKKNKK
jgi:translocation protein SEC66